MTRQRVAAKALQTQIAIRVSLHMARALRKRARFEGITVAEYVRRLIEKVDALEGAA